MCHVEGHYDVAIFGQFLYDWLKLSLSLHQQARRLLSKVTAVTQAILLTVPSLLSPLCLCLSSLPHSDRCQLSSPCVEGPPPPSAHRWPCYPIFNVNSLAPDWRELPHFLLPIRKKTEEQQNKMQSLTLFQPMHRVWLLLPPGETQGQDCLDKTPRVLTFQPCCLFLVFAPQCVFGARPDDEVEFLRPMQSPGSPGTRVSLAEERGLLGDESQLRGSGEVTTLWSRPLGGPTQAQTQLGMEPVLCAGGVHRKRTALCWQGKCGCNWISRA